MNLKWLSEADERLIFLSTYDTSLFIINNRLVFMRNISTGAIISFLIFCGAAVTSFMGNSAEQLYHPSIGTTNMDSSFYESSDHMFNGFSTAGCSYTIQQNV